VDCQKEFAQTILTFESMQARVDNFILYQIC